MNKLEVQEVYDKVSTPRAISAIETLGLKSCLFDDLFGTYSVENISDTDVYIQVKSKIESLCEYALYNEPEPVAKDWNGDDIYIGGTVYYDGDPYTVRAYDKKGNGERILVTKNDEYKKPLWFYIGYSDVTVRDPNAQGGTLYDAASALRALQDTLQKDVFSKLETALESLLEAQKD
nr:MAG TPA: hypothetical protein [Caudoviricetes sp.]